MTFLWCMSKAAAQAKAAAEAKAKAEAEAKAVTEKVTAEKAAAAADAKVVILANIAQYVCLCCKSTVCFRQVESIEMETMLKHCVVSFPVKNSSLPENFLPKKRLKMRR